MGVTGTKMNKSTNALLELMSCIVLVLIVCFYLLKNVQLDLRLVFLNAT